MKSSAAARAPDRPGPPSRGPLHQSPPPDARHAPARPAWLVWVSWLLLLVLGVSSCARTPAPAPADRGTHRIDALPPGAVFYLGDHQNTPVVVTDAHGEVVRQAAHHPYGSVRSERGGLDDPFAYVGNERDPRSGLNDFHARPYLPTTATFLEPDPVAVFSPEQVLAEPTRLAAYGYGSGDPINRTDPGGELWGALAAGAAAFIGVTFVAQYANAPTRAAPQIKHKSLTRMAVEASALAIDVHGTATGGFALATGIVALGRRAISRAAARVGIGKAAVRAPPPTTAAAATSATFPDKTYYRCMSRAEAKAVRDSGRLRGGDPGHTYFTDTRFRTAARAKDRLSLEHTPEVQMQFRIRNSPRPVRNGGRIAPKNDGRGQAREYSTTDPVEVEIINVQPFSH